MDIISVSKTEDWGPNPHRPANRHKFVSACIEDFVSQNWECEGAYWCTICNQEYEICLLTGGYEE